MLTVRWWLQLESPEKLLCFRAGCRLIPQLGLPARTRHTPHSMVSGLQEGGGTGRLPGSEGLGPETGVAPLPVFYWSGSFRAQIQGEVT